MSTTRAGIRQIVRLRINDIAAVVVSDAMIDQFIHDAIDDYSDNFPQETTATIAAVAGQREYSLTSYTGLQQVLEVEYPTGQTPPSYLRPRSRDNVNGFYGKRFFDVYGRDYPTTLIIGPSPANGESIKLRYSYDHTFPDSDVEALTIRDDDANLLILCTEWLCMRAVAMGEAGQPNLGTNTLSQRIQMADELRQEYQLAVARRAGQRVPSAAARPPLVEGTGV